MIDWDAVHARIATAEVALEEALNPSPERAKVIMDARARALSRPAEQAGARARIDVVIFSLGREQYCIEARYVREVSRLTHLTPVPGTPDFVLGVTNLRGTVLALLDLRRFFGVVPTGLTDMSRVLVLGTDSAAFGIMVDDSHRHVELETEDILPPGPDWPDEVRPLVRGVAKDALIVVDGEALLSDPRTYVSNR
jgi:purine-binding chemotaxis protein CheW